MSHPHTRGYFLTQVYEEFPVNNFIIKSDLLDPKCPRLADHNPGSLGDTLRLNPPGSVGGGGGHRSACENNAILRKEPEKRPDTIRIMSKGAIMHAKIPGHPSRRQG